MNTTEMERQPGTSRRNTALGPETNPSVDLAARIIERLEQLQFIQAELLAKAQAWNRVALISETDSNGRILSVNDNFVRTSGYTRDELLGQNHNLLKSGHQHDSVFEQLWQQLLAGKVWRGYLKNKNQKGEYFWVYSTIFPVLDENRTPARFYSVAIQISELIEPSEELKLNLLPAFALTPDSQSRQLQQLRQQLQTLKAEHDHALRAVHKAVLIAETDSRGIITAVNDHFVEVSGYEKHELIGQNHRLVKSPEQSPTVYDELWQTISQGITWRGLLINRSKTGNDYRIEIQITPELDEEGKVRRYLALSWKLSEATELAFSEAAQLQLLRVEMEQLAQNYDESQRLIAELEAMQQLLFSQVSALNAAASVLELDAMGQITFVNDAFIERTGFMRESLFGQPFGLIVGESIDVQDRSAIERAISSSIPWRGELPTRTQSDGEFWAYLVVHPVENPDTGIIDKTVLVFTDIQRIKQQTFELEHELRLLRSQEQELQRTITDLYYKNTQLQRIQHEHESRQVGLEQAFPLIETDPTGIVLFVNDVFCRQYATRPADWMGKGFDTWLSTRISPDMADAWLIQSRTASAAPLLLPPQEFDLQPIPFAAFDCPIHDSEGNWVKQLYLLVPAPESFDPKATDFSTTIENDWLQAQATLEANVSELREQLESQTHAAETEREELLRIQAGLQAQLADLQNALIAPSSQEGMVSIEVYRASELARETLEQRIQALVRDKEANYSNFQKAHEINLKLQSQYEISLKELEDERRWAAELQERYAQLERDFRTLENESENKNVQIEQFKRKYADLEQLNEEVVLNVQELRNQLRDVQLELEYAQEQDAQRTKSLNKQAEELEQLRIQLEKQEIEKKSFIADLDSARLRIEKLVGEKASLQSEIDSLTNRIEKQYEDKRFLEIEIESLTNRLEKQRDEKRFLETEIDSLNSRLEKQNEDRRFLQIEIDSFTDRLEKQAEDRRFVENEMQSLKDRYETLSKEKYRLEEELLDLKFRYFEEQKTRARLEDDLRDYRSEQDNLTLKLARIDHQRNELQAERDALNQRFLQITHEADHLRHELDSVGDQAQALTFDNERLSNRIRELERQLADYSHAPTASAAELHNWVGFSPPQPVQVSVPAQAVQSTKILFVEADFPRLDTVSQWMKAWGIDCKVSARGDDALPIYESLKPDAVILDLRLPGLNGFELTDVIRNDYEDQQTKIIALTPTELLAHRTEYIRSGFTEVIGKPYSQSDLERVLRQLKLLS